MTTPARGSHRRLLFVSQDYCYFFHRWEHVNENASFTPEWLCYTETTMKQRGFGSYARNRSDYSAPSKLEPIHCRILLQYLCGSCAEYVLGTGWGFASGITGAAQLVASVVRRWFTSRFRHHLALLPRIKFFQPGPCYSS